MSDHAARFASFARAHGLIVDRVVASGRIQAVRTEDKPHKRNGRYRFDGLFGWVQNWATMDRVEVFEPPETGDPAQDREAAQRYRERLSEHEREERAKHEKAAAKARAIVAGCRYDSHPYFGLKGLYGEQGLIDPEGCQFDREDPESRETDCLVVPMRSFQTGDIQSVQWIGASGRKKYLPDGRARGGIYAIGPRTGPAWLVEGLATGLSVNLALKELYRQERVIVCFSASNLKHVAERIGGVLRIVADNDHEDRHGRRAGQDAAKATGLPWVMPPDEGDDANDHHRKYGVRSLSDLMRSVM